QGVAFLSPLPAAAAGATAATSARGGVDGADGSGAGTSSGAAGASAAGGRSIDSASPTTRGPYPLSDHYPLPHGRGTERARGVGSDEGIAAGAPPGPSQITLAQDTVGSRAPGHASYPSNSGTFPPSPHEASGHTSLASMGIPPSSYPFVAPQRQGPEAFGSGYPTLPQSARNGSGGAPPNPPAPVVLPQQAPGGTAAGGNALSPATPAAASVAPGTAAVQPPASPPRMGIPMPSCPPSSSGGHNLLGGAPLATATPFATATADSSEASPVQPSGGGGAAARSITGPSRTVGGTGSVGGGPIEPFRQPLPNGLPPRSEDSTGNLSGASSLAGTNNNYQIHYLNHQVPKQQRNMQGLRPIGPMNGVGAPAAMPPPPPPLLQPVAQPAQQHALQLQQQPPQQQAPQQQTTALARVSERPAVDAAPPRNKGVPMTETERALMNVFTGGGGGGNGDTLSTNKLPAVGPLTYNIGNDGVLETSQTDIATTSKSGADAGPSTADGQPAMPMAVTQYPAPFQQYFAPPSPISRTPTPGATSVPPAVSAAANDSYGAQYGAPYPPMPPPSTDALPQPPPHLQHPMGPAAAYGGLVMPQGWSHHPFNDPRLPAQGYPGAQQGHTRHLIMSAMTGSSLTRTSEYGLGPVQQQLFMHGIGQHVPGPQISNGRRNSNMSDLDMPSPFDTDSGPCHVVSTCDFPAGEVGLPVPPQVAPQLPFSPPPVVTPAAPPSQNPQLSQNCFIRSEDLRNVEQIGEGAEGVVYRGRWHHIDVAVKEMHPSSASFTHLASIGKDLSAHDPASTEDLAGLIKEVAALIDLGQHPNIIRFIGICTSPPRIVTEYYKMGSLYSLLKEARQGNIRTREKLAWDKRLIMLKDIAAGMAYLHSRDYIHGDLRSPNVFVTEDQHLKIGDFGFARILGKAQNHVVPARLTNPRWQAPEVYDMADPIATTAADVYSFGIIMYEMLTFRLPYDEATEDEVVKLRHTFDPSWRPHVPPDKQLPVQKSVHAEGQLPPLQAYKTLMMDCWAVDPANRPGFHKIAGRLNALCHWQWALSVIKRSLMYRQLSKTRGGIGGGGGSADLTPSCMTPTSVSSPTASVRGGNVPSQVLNHMLAQVASTLQQDPGLERQVLDGGLYNKQGPHYVASSTAPAAPALPMLPQLPPLQGASAAAPSLSQAAPAMASLPPQVPQPWRLASAQPPPQTTIEPLLGSANAGAPHQQPHQQIQRTAAGADGISAYRTVLHSSRPVDAAASYTVAAAPAAVMDASAVAASGSHGSTASLAVPQPARGGLSQARPPSLMVAPEPVLEPVPTIPSTGSRPLQVPAAVTTLSFPAGPSPLAPIPKLSAGDGHLLMSPFKEMQLSDDEEDTPGANRAMQPRRQASSTTSSAYSTYMAHAVAAAEMAARATAAAESAQESRNINRQQQQRQQQQLQQQSAATVAMVAPPSQSTVMPTAFQAARMGSALLAAPPGNSSLSQAELPVAPRTMEPSRAPMPAMSPVPVVPQPQPQPALVQRQSSSSLQPAPHPPDPLEMRTVFHMGIGFSIDDDY
ncbi:hypothetical protein Vretimale_12047, partial [Volvox reticuliferus]